jgi:hypothetical protein
MDQIGFCLVLTNAEVELLRNVLSDVQYIDTGTSLNLKVANALLDAGYAAKTKFSFMISDSSGLGGV